VNDTNLPSHGSTLPARAQTSTEDDLPTTFGIKLQAHTGPLPPAAEMAAYADIDPAIPMRIIAMAEANAAAERHSIDRAQTLQFRENMVGRVLAFIFAMTGLIVALLMARSGHDGAAATIGGAVVAGTVVALVTGRAKTAARPDEE